MEKQEKYFLQLQMEFVLSGARQLKVVKQIAMYWFFPILCRQDMVARSPFVD